MSRRRHYEDLSATRGDDGWSRWVRPISRGYRISCCDCGLVHAMEFRTRGRVVEVRFARDNRSTGARRRHKQPTHERTFLQFAARTLAALYAEIPNELDGFMRRFRRQVNEARRRRPHDDA